MSADQHAAQAFHGRSVVSAADFTKAEVLALLEAARQFDRFDPGGPAWGGLAPTLSGRVLGTLFFEPSTRTRLSFESAMLRLGGSVLGFADARISSLSKGESLVDTIQVVEGYCDAIVLRHPSEGAARLAAETARIPVINGGDGSNQHPTQTFLDLYTIREAAGRLDGLKVGFMGDLRYGRTVHSLTEALLHFDVELKFIGPENLRLPRDLRDHLRRHGRSGLEVENLQDAGDLDVLYMTRIQKERFPDPMDYERIRNAYRVDRAALAPFGPDLKVLHPLPRVNEVAPDVDSLPGALYFRQTRNGVTVRMALLHLLLGGALPLEGGA
ncbi:MAG: aspartate carbamoyltransferase [Planctomycetota bacterium]|nr:aspartate carbamoyltransferase [Planctomycetota bacterium]